MQLNLFGMRKRENIYLNIEKRGNTTNTPGDMEQYISKSALVAEIEKRYECWKEKEFNSHNIESEIRMSECQHLMLLLNTLEVKEIGNNLWHPADSDDLPEIDRDVIALLSNGKVVYAHRPPEYWNGKNIITNEVTRYEPKRYDKGGWNQPDVKWWLDLDLPKMEE